MSATKNTIIAILVIAVTFLTGVSVGVFGAYALHRRGGDHIPRFAAHAMISRLDRHLDLTDDQRKKIEAIVERRHQRINTLWRQMRPRVQKELMETNEEIERVLTPAQREEFEKMKLHLGPPHGRHGHREERRRP